MWSEPKGEPTEASQQPSDPFWAWLAVVVLIGRIAVLELDLEGNTDAAEE